MTRAASCRRDANLASVAAALANINRASTGLPQTIHDLNALLGELRGASADLGASARSVRSVVDEVQPDVRVTAQRLHTIADNLTDATAQIDQTIAES